MHFVWVKFMCLKNTMYWWFANRKLLTYFSYWFNGASSNICQNNSWCFFISCTLSLNSSLMVSNWASFWKCLIKWQTVVWLNVFFHLGWVTLNSSVTSLPNIKTNLTLSCIVNFSLISNKIWNTNTRTHIIKTYKYIWCATSGTPCINT